MTAMKYNDLTSHRDFQRIPLTLPANLSEPINRKLAVQYFASKYYNSLNIICRTHGYEARQRTLYAIAELVQLYSEQPQQDQLERDVASMVYENEKLR